MRDCFTHDAWYCLLMPKGFGHLNHPEPCRWSAWIFITDHYLCSTHGVFEEWPNNWLIAHYILFIPLTLEGTAMPNRDPVSRHASVLYKCWTFYVCGFPKVGAVITHSSLWHRYSWAARPNTTDVYLTSKGPVGESLCLQSKGLKSLCRINTA